MHEATAYRNSGFLCAQPTARHQGENKTVGRIAGRLNSLHTRNISRQKDLSRHSEVHEAS